MGIRGPSFCAMLFLLKKRFITAAAGLTVLTAVGLSLRAWLPGVLIALTPAAFGLGVLVFLAVLLSDGTIHGLLLLIWGKEYRRRHRALASLFRGQAFAAILLGALMAGIGEELVFRGVSLSPTYLFGAAILFGLLHHIRLDLWPFTIWSIWQGFLFATAIYITEALCVTMVAHFLHDLAGFLIFRHLNRQHPLPPACGEGKN
jgi:membrane protease YdiL (CAAX protease family)